MASKVIWVALLACLVGGAIWVDYRADQRERAAEIATPALGQFVEVDGQKVHILITGSGPDLVLIHGASGNLRDFTFDFVDRLSAQYRVIVLDRPGMGWSERSDPAFDRALTSQAESPREQARMLRAAAVQLGLEQPIVLGHSFGASVAMAWALEFSEETRGLVILAGATNPWPGTLDLLYRVNGSALGGALVPPLITAFAPEDRVTAAVDSIFAPQEAPEGYAEYVGAEMTLRRGTFRANARQVNGLRPHVVEMAPFYSDIMMPTEILHGDADVIVPLEVHALVLDQIIPDSNLTVLRGVGHMPHHTNPEDVIAAIARVAERSGLR